MSYALFRPLLFCLDPERAHRFAQRYLRLFGTKKVAKQSDPVTLLGLQFPNKVGLAAGWDKDGECIDVLFGLGFGFVEVGTVTPRPQEGNARPRLFRLVKSQALINRMGFNNKGVDYLIERLKKRRVPGIVGVNIGKNKDTPNQRAHEDYVFCLQKVYPYADYITINISSPNTPGLRDLHQQASLDLLLGELDNAREQLARERNKRVPMLIKISPDYPHKELDVFVKTLLKHNIDGIIATNTSLSRQGVMNQFHADEQGGLSGRPIAERSTDTIAKLRELAATQLPIIGVGGIDSRAAADAKYAAGADLIQVFTGLVYQGPGLIKQLV